MKHNGLEVELPQHMKMSKKDKKKSPLFLKEFAEPLKKGFITGIIIILLILAYMGFKIATGGT